MTVTLINPDTLPTPQGYSQVGVATGTRTVYVAGQVARTSAGEPVGPGDLAAQAEQAFHNVAAALAAAGGGFSEVAKLTVYIVDLTPEKLGAFVEGAGAAAVALGVVPDRPTTLIGVAALAEPDLLVEIEAVAVLP